MGACCSTLFASSPTNPELSHDLNLANQDIPKLDYAGRVFLAYCADVIDGDTVKLNIQTHIGTYQYSVRLAHIDSPELKSAEAVEKRHAQACKLFVKQLLWHKFCVIKCGKLDKFGRLLGDLFVGQVLCGAGVIKTGDMTMNDVVEISQVPPGGKVPLKYLVINDFLLAQTPCVPYEGRAKMPFYFKAQYHPAYIEMLKTV
jgi:hypothetical protein